MHVRVNNRGNNSHCAPPASCISLPCCLPLNPQQQPSFLSPLAVGLFLSSFFCGSEKRTRELCVGENQKEKGTDKFSSARPAFLSGFVPNKTNEPSHCHMELYFPRNLRRLILGEARRFSHCLHHKRSVSSTM